MSTTKYVKNIHTTITEGDTHPMQVKWTLSYYYDTPEELHQDDTCQSQAECRDVEKILSVEIELFGRQGIDMTPHFVGEGSSRNLRHLLEKQLLEAVEYQSIEELTEEVEAA